MKTIKPTLKLIRKSASDLAWKYTQCIIPVYTAPQLRHELAALVKLMHVRTGFAPAPHGSAWPYHRAAIKDKLVELGVGLSTAKAVGNIALALANLRKHYRDGYDLYHGRAIQGKFATGTPVADIARLTRAFLSGRSDKPAYCMLKHDGATKGAHGETELEDIGVFASPPLGLSDPDREAIPLGTPGECRAFTAAIAVCNRAFSKKLPSKRQA